MTDMRRNSGRILARLLMTSSSMVKTRIAIIATMLMDSEIKSNLLVVFIDIPREKDFLII